MRKKKYYNFSKANNTISSWWWLFAEGQGVGTTRAGGETDLHGIGCAGSMSTPRKAANRLLKWVFASEFDKNKHIKITVEWIDILGTPIWVCWMTLMMVLVKKLKANIRLRVVNGMKLDMTNFLPRFGTEGLILRVLRFVFAIISEEIMHAVVMNAMVVNGNAPSYSFSVPI